MSEKIAASLSVLVVEDDPDTAQSTAELVTLCGCGVRVAASGPDAIREAAAQMPDVIFLDIGLPGENGWSVARQLRALATGKQPIIVVVTGHAEAVDRERSADAGADLHWAKPTDPAVLMGLLEKVSRLLTPPVGAGGAP